MNSSSQPGNWSAHFGLLFFLQFGAWLPVHASAPVSPKVGTFVIPTKTYGTAPFTIIPPISTSKGTWSYSSGNSKVATVSGFILTISGVGTATITATQAATGSYSSAKTSTTFKVTPATPKLGAFVIPPQGLRVKSFTITPPTSTSAGSWSYASSKPKVATVSGSKVTLVGAGTTTITATQAATANWLSAATNAMLIVIPSFVASTDSFGSGANTFTIDFVPIGNPGNSNDKTGYGGVPYAYRMGKYTISQNQIESATRNGLQNVAAGPWFGDQPATSIYMDEAAAFVNWLNISKGYAPAYNLTFSNGVWKIGLWSTKPDPKGNVAWTLGGTNLFRNANCVYFLPNESEWYKAAYYDPNKNGGAGGYWLYPTCSDSAPISVASGTDAGTVVYSRPWEDNPASVFQAGGLSPYGTMGQGGNVSQWTDGFPFNYNSGDNRFMRSCGDIHGGIYWIQSSNSYCLDVGGFNWGGLGFRVARKP